MNGWIILDKGEGLSSAQALNRLKKMLKAEKLGHAGTLDPLATGVLPVALGEATKTLPYVVDTDKSYLFEVSWGQETETDDREGAPVQTSPNRPSEEHIRQLLSRFTGQILQVPPHYSAIKLAGKRAYELARGDHEFELSARPITVHHIEMVEYNSDRSLFSCDCGKGTYIRSLARDMGRALGCYGYVSLLRRTRVGRFSEKHAISLEKLGEFVHKGDLGFIRPVASVLDDIPAIHVTAQQALKLRQGQMLPWPQTQGSPAVAVYEDGRLVALAEQVGGALKPQRVFNHT